MQAAVEVPLPRKGHPKGLYLLFFSEMWERFSFYGMRALLVFYMTKKFLFGDEQAYAVYGSYTALVYATPIIGGYIADRFLGFRKAVVLGGVLMALGHFAMAFEHLQVFYLALALLICGNGFFKPNISTIVGRLYPPGDPRRDGGFTIFYMGINLGAGVAPLLCGYIGETYGWHYGFMLAGIGMVVGLVVFLRGQKLLEGHAEPPHPEKLAQRLYGTIKVEWAIYAAAGIGVLCMWPLVQLSAVVGYLLTSVGVVASVALVAYAVARVKGQDRHKMVVALILILFSMVFWSFFEQAGSSINLFTDRNVDRSLVGIEIPASVFQSINPAFILLLGPLFAAMWTGLGLRKREPSTPIKFGLGIVQLGLGFIVLWWGASHAHDGMVGIGWLVLGYLLHTTGELCLSPVGLSMITKLSPPAIVGMMMGTWFLSSAFAQYIAAIIAMLTGVQGEGEGPVNVPASETVMVYGGVFGQIAIVSIVVGALVLLVAPLLRRGMHDVH